MAIIGLMSDSHGRAEVTRLAVARLLAAGAQVLVHLGDIETTAVLDALVGDGRGGEGLPATHVVFGNADYDWAALARYARHLGLAVHHPFGEIEADGQRVIFMHGHDQAAMKLALAQRPAYLCHGHTHHPQDTRCGPTRVVNPGALFRAARRTVATLDSVCDNFVTYDLDKT